MASYHFACNCTTALSIAGNVSNATRAASGCGDGISKSKLWLRISEDQNSRPAILRLRPGSASNRSNLNHVDLYFQPPTEVKATCSQREGTENPPGHKNNTSHDILAPQTLKETSTPNCPQKKWKRKSPAKRNLSATSVGEPLQVEPNP